ncbi:MAG: hypothetical protein A2261_04055 [Candidatus Magasanikbacteria bacterium RIFOXYA2_FULL_44_8]|uniref:Ligand-binding protein SH3 n=1 Tax=Candidatus Magasanikbacteria bacterium RIFOXYA2_FULL_44_8 TaxID=1798696 RepID=A0A1F6NIZ1_9BACT|nr:MAG: hypothetical protein A2261_04055 [Candidatus Magasanikbacteria bacterium RIFOXYA2_FULL_44_8]
MWHNLILNIIHFFSIFPHELATFLLGMVPIGEVRLALPVAILRYRLPVWEAYLLAVAGNIIPAFIIAAGADSFHRWVNKRAARWGKDWADYLADIQKKFSGHYVKYGLWGLLIFIGSSLPGTGAYTGAIAAFVFGIPFKKSWPYILGGVMVSGLITLLLTVGFDKIF